MKTYNLKLFLLGALLQNSTEAVLQNIPVSSFIGSMGSTITTEINEIEVPVEIQSSVIVTNNNIKSTGWVTEYVEKHNQTSVTSVIKNTNYITIPCQSIDWNKGIHLKLPISTADNELRRIRLRNTQFSGVFLRDITRLTYSAFVTLTHNNIAPSLVLQIDTSHDDKVDFNLTFQPAVQESQNNPCDGIMDFQAVNLAEWQTWNAGEGWWEVGLEDDIPNLPDFFTLAGFVERFPSGRILNSTDLTDIHAGGGIRLTVGADETNKMDFEGFIDHFMIDYFSYYGVTPIHNKIRYDFERDKNCDVWNGMPYKWYSRN